MIVHRSLVVAPEDERRRLDVFLSRKYPHLSRARWQKKIRLGKVFIDGEKISPSAKLKAGQTIRYSYSLKQEPPVNADYKVIYRDDAFIVINKPANLPVLPSGIYLQNNLANLLKKEFPPGQKIHLINRIDRETSGILLVGCTKEAAVRFQKMFFRKEIKKEYLVLVEGDFDDYMDAPGFLMKDPESTVFKKVKFTPMRKSESRSAEPDFKSLIRDNKFFVRTEFFKLKSANGLSLLKANLHTGKMHQIRATLCSIGFPVVGDKIYGVDENIFLSFIDGRLTLDQQKLLRLDRCALHSYKISFPHPVTDILFTMECPMPEEFSKLLE